MNYSGNKKGYYFEIYYSEESAGTSCKYQSFYDIDQSCFETDEYLFMKNLSRYDLECVTKSTFQKLVYGLKNEDSDISYMFYDRNMEVHLTY